MSTIAIVMMIVALLAVWGGLCLALLNLKRHPEEPDDGDDGAVAPASEAPLPGKDGDKSPEGPGGGRHRGGS